MAIPKITFELIEPIEFEEGTTPPPYLTPGLVAEYTSPKVLSFGKPIIANGQFSDPIHFVFWNNKNGLNNVLDMKDCYMSVVNKYGTNDSSQTVDPLEQVDGFIQAMGNGNPSKRWLFAKCDSKKISTYTQIGSLSPSTIQIGAIPIGSFEATDNSISGRANTGTLYVPIEVDEEGNPIEPEPGVEVPVPDALGNASFVSLRVRIQPEMFSDSVNFNGCIWLSYKID